MSAVLTIAGFTLREAARRRVLFGAAALTLVFLVLYGLAVFFALREVRTGGLPREIVRLGVASGLLLAGLYVINSIASLLALLTGVVSIASDIADGTLQAVVPRPVRRWQIVFGKWLGLAVVLTIYLAFTTLAATATVWALGEYFPSAFLSSLGLMLVGILLLLSLCVAVSTVCPTLAGGVVAFMLYSVGTLGGLIGQIGVLANNRTMEDISFVTNLLMPADAVSRLAAVNLRPDLPLASLALTGGPFGSLSPPPDWIGAYAVVYAVLALASAVFLFRRRDL